MVDFVQLQELMKERLAKDRTIQTVEARGPTLEDAVAEAATLLGVSLRRVEYEITEKGSPGFLGSGKKDWKIKAYQRAVEKKEKNKKGRSSGEEEFISPVIEDRDGDAFVFLGSEGAFLKVIPPVGRGRRANESHAMNALHARNVQEIDENAVRETVRQAAGVHVKVGTFAVNPMNDAMISVDIAAQEMKATIYLTPPGSGGCDLSADAMLSFLHNNNVVFGINEVFLREFADRPRYNEAVLVAEGARPENGADARMQYNFETDQSRVKLREGADGKVDFKDLNIIQNVVEGQPLAKKIDPQRGEPGHTVTGKIIPAKNGKDIALPLGKNVHVAEDEHTIVADMNGQVVVVGAKINVEPVYTVNGDVNLKTGNIIFLGTVIITGNVEDGFSVKAAGNIEVRGTVEKAELDAEGDIIVYQGITGKNGGSVKSGRSIWARFIENGTVEAGNMVVVSDGIVNSRVDANKRIICQGKRAHIVGGRLRASEEINAKVIGSPMGGAETICEVGYDPREKAKLDALQEDKAAAEKQLEDIQLNLQTLINIKKQRKSLPEDKEAYMHELMDKREELTKELAKLNKNLEDVQNYLNNLKTRGKVSASSKVYPGVKIVIRDVKEDVRNDYRAVTFILENSLIRVTKYEEPGEEAKRGPDGYTTN